MKQLNPLSKKKELLFVKEQTQEKNTNTANNILLLLNEYRQLYTLHIDENGSIDEVIEAIQSNSKEQLLQIKFSDDKEKLQVEFPQLDEKDVLEMLGKKSIETVHNLIDLSNHILKSLKSSTMELEDFILNDNFIINSKVKTKIKNNASIYCTSARQVELRNLAVKLSVIVQDALKSGLLAPNKLGVNTENILNVNTGDIHYHYIMRC